MAHLLIAEPLSADGRLSAVVLFLKQVLSRSLILPALADWSATRGDLATIKKKTLKFTKTWILWSLRTLLFHLNSHFWKPRLWRCSSFPSLSNLRTAPQPGQSLVHLAWPCAEENPRGFRPERDSKWNSWTKHSVFIRVHPYAVFYLLSSEIWNCQRAWKRFSFRRLKKHCYQMITDFRSTEGHSHNDSWHCERQNTS